MPKQTANAPKPDLLCIGDVIEVGELKPPTEFSTMHSFAITLNPFQNGQKATIFLKFWPEAFTAAFDPQSIEPNRELPTRWTRKEEGLIDTPELLLNDLLYDKFRTHSKFIGSDSGDAVLQVLVGDKWDAYNEAFAALEAAGKLDPETIRQTTAQFIRGATCIYRMRQQFRDGKLGQFYDVAQLYPLTDENLKRLTKDNSRRKTVVTFEVDEVAA